MQRLFFTPLLLLTLAGCTMTVNGQRKTFNPLDLIPAQEEKTTPASPKTAQKHETEASSTKVAAKEGAAKKVPAVAPGMKMLLDPATTENPFVLSVAPVETSTSSHREYSSCSNYDSYRSAAPVAEINLKSAGKIYVQSENSGLIVDADGRFWCFEHKTIGNSHPIQVGELDFKAGKYRVFAMGRKGATPATLMSFTIVDRMQEIADKHMNANVFKVNRKTSLNPAYSAVDLTPSQSILGKHLNLSTCGKTQMANRWVVPVAKINIESASVYRFESNKGLLYLRSEKGACFSGVGELEKGSYELYLNRRRDFQAAIDFAFTDDERAFVFADAPHIKSGDLKKPLPFQVVVRKAEYRVQSICGKGAQAPNFYLDVNKPLEKMRLRQLVANGDLQVTVAGPLGSQKRPYEWCKSGKGTWLKKNKKSNIKGTYAVWVSGHESIVGQDAYLLASSRRENRLQNLLAQGLPLQVLHPIKKTLSMPERQIWWHYPYYNRDTKAVEALFLDAPAQLFLFLTDDKDEIKATEPLLLQAYGTKKSVVLRANGERHTIRTERLTLEAPKKRSAPQWADLKMPKKVGTAQSLALPTDAVSFAKWYDLNDKKESCVYRYMKKNDPSWGKDYNVINTRTGEDVSDVYFRRADKKCNAKGVEKAATRVIKAAYQNRLKAQKKASRRLSKAFR